MTVFRVEKNQNYTVMSNYHLRNPYLSLKTKGRLSQMLSLPNEWDYTLKELFQINREDIDAIWETIRELEWVGYVTRTRVRNEKGQLGAADYVIHEFPVPPKPILENPTLETPAQENPTQINRKLSSKELLTKDLLSTHSISILSTPLPEGTVTPPEWKGNDYTNMDAVRAYEEVIMDNIEYTYLIQNKTLTGICLMKSLHLCLKPPAHTTRKYGLLGRLSGRTCKVQVYEAQQQPYSVCD